MKKPNRLHLVLFAMACCCMPFVGWLFWRYRPDLASDIDAHERYDEAGRQGKSSNTFVTSQIFRSFLLCLLLALTGSARADGAATIAALAAGKDSAVVPLDRSSQGHLLVSARINGKGPFAFILDTGAERNVLDQSLVKALGLGISGGGHVRVMGPHAVSYTQTDEVTLAIGDASLAKQKFLVLDMSKQKAVLGQTIQGALGANIFKNFVVTIDFGQKTVSLRLPNTLAYQGTGVVLPLGFRESHIPYIAGKIDGIDGTFNLDTGDPGALLLYADFAKKNHLREKFGSQLEPGTMAGVLGGDLNVAITPPMRLEIGGISVTMPVVLAQETRGATSVKDAAGQIGDTILAQTILTFDYPHKQVIFERPPDTADAVPK